MLHRYIINRTTMFYLNQRFSSIVCVIIVKISLRPVIRCAEIWCIFYVLIVTKGRDIASRLKVIIELIPSISKVLEEKRAQGLIGSSFDAQIILLTKRTFYYKYLEGFEQDLAEIFKVSCVSFEFNDEIGEGISFRVEKAEGKKCRRCWNWSISVGEDKQYSDICQRCLKQIREVKWSHNLASGNEAKL